MIAEVLFAAADYPAAKTNVRKAVGKLELAYQTFDVRESPGLQLTVASAAPGSSSEDALALLGTIEATRRDGSPGLRQPGARRASPTQE